MKIITIPHPTLRQTATKVTKFSDDLQRFVKNLQTTLQQTNNPRGVGLAAPQVDRLIRVFATHIEEDAQVMPRIFINPVATKQSKKHTFGADPENPRLEGCLSMPLLYGPVPRWEWVEVEYQTYQDNQLVEKRERFDGFHARVIQHEIDHLNGILFTDYSLKYELPVYREVKNELVELTDRSILELY
ncbi:MAG: Peptide deformylase [Candidatus Pacebacteria bacterium GW2011_GWA1_46_10]|nr:MAG: Peptide deformylase [Candidatus Pacebacteria bacterium GW2011_GWA1_46_10]HCR81628.1 peptide deformylase [Candidatus Paceibacterota bacterium]